MVLTQKRTRYFVASIVVALFVIGLFNFGFQGNYVRQSVLPFDEIVNYVSHFYASSFFVLGSSLSVEESLKGCTGKLVDKTVCHNISKNICEKDCKMINGSNFCEEDCHQKSFIECNVEKVCDKKENTQEESLNKSNKDSFDLNEGGSNFSKKSKGSSEDNEENEGGDSMKSSPGTVFGVRFNKEKNSFEFANCEHVVYWKGKDVLNPLLTSSIELEGDSWKAPLRNSNEFYRFGCNDGSLSLDEDYYYVLDFVIDKRGGFFDIPFDTGLSFDDALGEVNSWDAVYLKKGKKWVYNYYDGVGKKWIVEGIGKFLLKGKYYFAHPGIEREFVIVGRISELQLKEVFNFKDEK